MKPEGADAEGAGERVRAKRHLSPATALLVDENPLVISISSIARDDGPLGPSNWLLDLALSRR